MYWSYFWSQIKEVEICISPQWNWSWINEFKKTLNGLDYFIWVMIIRHRLTYAEMCLFQNINKQIQTVYDGEHVK